MQRAGDELITEVRRGGAEQRLRLPVVGHALWSASQPDFPSDGLVLGGEVLRGVRPEFTEGGAADLRDAFGELPVVALARLPLGKGQGRIVVTISFEFPEEDSDLVLGHSHRCQRAALGVRADRQQVDVARGKVEAFEG